MMVTALQRDEMVAPDAVGAVGMLTWLGHATVLLTTISGTRIMFDPWLDGNPKCPVTIDDMGDLDGICVTHGHFDHMASVVSLAASSAAAVVCVPEMAAYFSTLGVANVIEMNKGGTIMLADLSVTMVGADHSCGINVGDDVPSAYGGNPVGFVIGLPVGQGGPVYISGDTNVFGDMALIRDLYAPEIALIPIDGHYNMGPREAAHAVKLLGVDRVVPYHYGTFPLLTGTPEAFCKFLGDADPGSMPIVIDPGESVPLSG